MSIGLCRPSFDFCITNCASVQRIPPHTEANSMKTKPIVSNCVDLYVNMNNPVAIKLTMRINDKLYLHFSEKDAKILKVQILCLEFSILL